MEQTLGIERMLEPLEDGEACRAQLIREPRAADAADAVVVRITALCAITISIAVPQIVSRRSTAALSSGASPRTIR